MDIVNSVQELPSRILGSVWGKIESLPKESSYSSKMAIVYLDFVDRLSIFLPFG